MDSFKFLKRRTTELFQSLPSRGQHGANTIKGTWEKLQIPPLPRSSHSADVVAGTLYIFGGEVEPRRPVDNDMHAVTLPSSGAPADYYAIKAKPAKAAKFSAAVEDPVAPPADDGEPAPEPEEGADPAETPDSKNLSEVSLTTPSPGPSLAKGKATAPSSLPDVPPPRVGHASAVIGHRIFVFGGRGGPDMAPLEEHGRVWVFDTRTHLWSFLDPRHAAAGPATFSTPPPHPAARSYHAAVATPKPDAPHAKPFPAGAGVNRPPSSSASNPAAAREAWRDWALGTTAEREATLGTPQRPVVGVLAERAVDADADGYGTLVIHGGCVGDGSRTADVWAFDVRSRVWQRLPDAPGPARGGAALALSRGRLYRFGGFDGEAQHGAAGQLDVLPLGLDVFNDQVSAGEAVLCARPGGWESLVFGKEDGGYKASDPAARPLESAHGGDGETWPGSRSVAALEPVTVGGGREYLVLMLGEREASGVGHAGAGRFWDDVWAFEVPPEGMSMASVADTAFSVVGRRRGQGTWARVRTRPHDEEDEASLDGPGPRGWVASAPLRELEENALVVFGGLSESNRRLGDGWILRLG